MIKYTETCALVFLFLVGLPAAGLELMLPEAVPPERLTYTHHAEAPNVIYIQWDDYLFSFQLFEALVVAVEPRFESEPITKKLGHRKIDYAYFQWSQQGKNDFLLEHEQGAPVPLKIKTRVYVPEDSENLVMVEGAIENTGQRAWGAFDQALMCFRTRLNEDFIDPKGHGVYLHRIENKLPVSVYELVGAENNYFNFFVFDEYPHGVSYLPAILKTNQHGTRSVLFSTMPISSLAGNRDPGMSCIHANLALRAKAGETQTFRSRLIFHRNDTPATTTTSATASESTTSSDAP